MDNMSLSDVAAVTRNNDWGNEGVLWILVLFALMNNGGWGNNGFANAIGYENLATSNEVQRGFDNQNTMANEREILSAVNAASAQNVAATNQVFHDLMTYNGDKYLELQRDISGIALTQANAMASQKECCCEVLRAIDGVNYNMAVNTAAINEKTAEQAQRVVDMATQNKVEALQSRISQLELGQAMAGVIRYPNGFTYNAGANPFCGCGYGAANI